MSVKSRTATIALVALVVAHAAAAQEFQRGLTVEAGRQPSEPTASLVMQRFEPGVVIAKPGQQARDIAIAHCGYAYAAYIEEMVRRNPGLFVGSGELAVVKADQTRAVVKVEAPACLRWRNAIPVMVAKGDSPWLLAQKHTDVSLTAPGLTDFCAKFERLNGKRSLCRDFPMPRDVVLVPASSDSAKAVKWFTVLNFKQGVDAGARDDVLLTLASESATPVQPVARIAASEPAGSCPTPMADVDPKPILEVLYRKIREFNAANKQHVVAVVAVVDTGLANPTFFEPYLLKKGGKFVWRNTDNPSGDVEPLQAEGKFTDHGTHVAGLVVGGPDFIEEAAKHTDPDPKAVATWLPRIMPILIQKRDPGGDPFTHEGLILNAIEFYSHANPAQIVNVSYEFTFSETLVHQLKKAAIEFNQILVAAAGNDFEKVGPALALPASKATYPARLGGPFTTSFVTVGAYSSSGGVRRPAAFSQRGAELVDIFAPGECVRSYTFKPDTFRHYSGTSQAAPLVSFTAAMLAWFAVPLDKIKFRILATADYQAEFASISVARGALNITKALEFGDDLVVFTKTLRGGYERGVIEPANQDYLSNLCAGNVQPTGKVLRIAVGEGVVRYVLDQEDRFLWSECPLNPDLKLSLTRKVDGQTTAIPFGLSEVREIIPRPSWTP